MTHPAGTHPALVFTRVTYSGKSELSPRSGETPSLPSHISFHNEFDLKFGWRCLQYRTKQPSPSVKVALCRSASKRIRHTRISTLKSARLVRRIIAFHQQDSVLNEEANKAGALQCGDARVAYSFTGLATQGNFDTRRWLLSAILEAAPPEFQIEFIVKRLCEMATREFRQNEDLIRILPKRNRRLSL